MVLLASVAGLVVGFGVGLLVGRKNKKLADGLAKKVAELEGKLKEKVGK